MDCPKTCPSQRDPLLEQEIIISEKDNTEHHIPGYNYCGPGTKVGTRLISQVDGINDLDKACKVHDVEYMKYAGKKDKLQKSDKKLLEIANKISGISSWIVRNTFKGKRLLENIGLLDPIKFTNLLSGTPVCTQRLYGKYLSKHFL